MRIGECQDSTEAQNIELKELPAIVRAPPLTITFKDINDDNSYSTEAAHGNYSEFPDNHAIHGITDENPYIIIPGIIKKSKNILSFNNEGELTRFIHNKIVSLLVGPKKSIHREIPPITLTESRDSQNTVTIDHIHVCEVNQNERICYTIYFSTNVNKIVVLVTCYFAHNIKSQRDGLGPYKKNPSEDEFRVMAKLKSHCVRNFLNRRYPNGGWQNV
jgi:hypothetical protein